MSNRLALVFEEDMLMVKTSCWAIVRACATCQAHWQQDAADRPPQRASPEGVLDRRMRSTIGNSRRITNAEFVNFVVGVAPDRCQPRQAAFFRRIAGLEI